MDGDDICLAVFLLPAASLNEGSRRMRNTKPTPDDLDAPIWHVKNMAPVINRTERETFHLIWSKQIDVTKKGALYVSTRRRLLASLGVRA